MQVPSGKLMEKNHHNDIIISTSFHANSYFWAPGKGALAIRRIFSLVDMITKPKFSNCPNVFKIGLFR